MDTSDGLSHSFKSLGAVSNRFTGLKMHCWSVYSFSIGDEYDRVFKCLHWGRANLGALPRKLMFANIYRYERFPFLGEGNSLLKFVQAFCIYYVYIFLTLFVCYIYLIHNIRYIICFAILLTICIWIANKIDNNFLVTPCTRLCSNFWQRLVTFRRRC
jgi:hypothetical protein